MTRLLKSAVLSLLFALLFAVDASPALAQAPAVLTKVTVLAESPTETRFQLQLDPKANGFAPVGNDVNRPALGLALTTRGNGAVQPPLKGLVRQISFEQVETVLILRFSVTSAASVSASPSPSGPNTIDVTVSTAAPAVRVQADQGTVAAEPPPPLGYSPGDSYELVQLKYADVSEIVGLLSQGASVKSNDLFIPHEPAFGSNSLTGGTYNPSPTVQEPGTDDSTLR